MDLARLWEAVEEMNSVTVLVQLRSCVDERTPSVSMLAQAFTGEVGSPEAKCLASVSAICLGMSKQTMDAALFLLLYSLDGNIAENEMFGRTIAE